MVSISQARLNELQDLVDAANEAESLERNARQVAQAKVAQFDTILDKIIRAAEGRPLIDDRNNFYGNGGYMHSDMHRCQPPTVEEVLREQVTALNDRVVGLESRLAAVVAVTQFAKAHKS